MTCKDCILWVQETIMIGRKKRKLDKGTCLNSQFSSHQLHAYTTTSPTTRCSSGIKEL